MGSRSESDLVGGDQNNQTVQPLVAGENDQNVKSKADGKKKAKSPGTDKKCRDKKKLKTEDTERQLEETRSENDELKKKIAYLNGKVDQAKEDMELITGARHRVLIRPRAEPRKNATPVAGTTGCSMFWPLGGLDFKQSLCPSHEVERAHWNTAEQPALSNGGLAQGGDLLGSHGLNYTSPPRAAMASGSSPMQGSLAPGGPARLSFEVTGFGTGETGLPVHHPPVHQCGTTMGSGGLAVEDSLGLPQSELSQVWTHLSMPSTSILENLSLPSTSFLENLSMPSTPILENLSMPSTHILENDWIED